MQRLASSGMPPYSPAVHGKSGFNKRMDPRIIDDLAKRLAASVPESLQAIRRDVETNFRAVLQGGLSRLDLVTRQEFDVQVAVLRRTREKLEALEKRLAEMDKADERLRV